MTCDGKCSSPKKDNMSGWWCISWPVTRHAVTGSVTWSVRHKTGPAEGTGDNWGKLHQRVSSANDLALNWMFSTRGYLILVFFFMILTLHIPQPVQWNCFLSSSSYSLHSKQKYFPNTVPHPSQLCCTGCLSPQTLHSIWNTRVKSEYDH